MSPAETIAEFHAAIDINGDNVYVLEQIKELLLPALQRFPDHEDLLLETALAFDTLVEHRDMAILFYEKIRNAGRVEFIVNYARCVAQTGDKERALGIIDGSAVRSHPDAIEIRRDIDDELWG